MKYTAQTEYVCCSEAAPTCDGLQKQEASQPLAFVHVLQVVAGEAVKGGACHIHNHVGYFLAELHVISGYM